MLLNQHGQPINPEADPAKNILVPGHIADELNTKRVGNEIQRMRDEIDKLSKVLVRGAVESERLARQKGVLRPNAPPAEEMVAMILAVGEIVKSQVGLVRPQVMGLTLTYYGEALLKYMRPIATETEVFREPANDNTVSRND